MVTHAEGAYGAYMQRSLAEFWRACETRILEEQRHASPDTALMALLCDAVRVGWECHVRSMCPIPEPPAGLNAVGEAAQAVVDAWPHAACHMTVAELGLLPELMQRLEAALHAVPKESPMTNRMRGQTARQKPPMLLIELVWLLGFSLWVALWVLW